ncbi:glycine--tRNA ligase, chloroplastic/mitochondrial 2 isoform X2 [Amborella trichopoda]|uniref:glycine--tRNA ligase, chloroplastic/mitochondrial 2 isoform X2 n=1 Tax=Amborella trichopoda TaxID=13333 RepID=UPI0009BE0AE8|nr:glycine--tRNA ligase, chloroplastic/mitochondrial 2 isoform X2 [Amborella trichopoda]|eukprot:XP_020519270.1 glycine--tRNA ligase, chloroplastic/mitochondrial 2 isoform X2 [Amborella trichopoda]
MAFLASPKALFSVNPLLYIERFCRAPFCNSLERLLLLSQKRAGNLGIVASKASYSSVSSSTLKDLEKEPVASAPTFQQAIQRLQEYWASNGCAVMQCSNTEVGAGTMNPMTFLRVLGPEPWNVAYVEPSIRPDDSRYGDNPNRLQRHTQFQVILKPEPGNSQDLYIRSLSALGINVNDHDIRFVEDNWESPFDRFLVPGDWAGKSGWMAGSLQLLPVSVEITYGLERILMLLQGVDHFKKVRYTEDITYGELFLENEKEMSAYYLEHAHVGHIQQNFELYEGEAQALLSLGLAIPAYDQLLKTSHAFNILDARGFVGVTERARYFGRMRSLARQCAQLWVKTRESLGHPLGVFSELGFHCHPKAIVEELGKEASHPRAFVLEVGTEELPPDDVIDACQQLEMLIVQILLKRRLSHGKVSACATPRRLVVYIDMLSSKQEEKEVEVRGPPVDKAFDHQGNPTKAAEGFCRKNGVPLGALFKQIDGKIEYVYVRTKESARRALEVLAEDLPGVLSKISFSKSMRWNSQVMFSRPIRWILALHGSAIVPFVYAGVLSGKQSCGLRNSKSSIFEVNCAEDYMTTISQTGIYIGIEQRKNKILQLSHSLAKCVGGILSAEDDAIYEVVNLVEAPVPILGSFDESFLELPQDLLVTVMRKHQKYFSIVDASMGKLLPFFISVANGVINERVVRKGNEAVLRARYEDAKFFYNLDIQKDLSEFRAQLGGILFHEKLGTMLDKAMRLELIVTKLSSAIGLGDENIPIIKQAAALALSDLATSVVMEFTSLSGIMARHYALRNGYSEQVSEAISEMALPRFSGDVLPKTDAGIVLAIADRLDSLVGLYGAGCHPTSTNDPFGLRRISYGLVQILVENEKNLDLRNALTLAASVQPIPVDAHVLEDAFQFITRRLEQFLVDKDISAELVRAVLSERANCPCLAAKSAMKMEILSKSGHLPKIVEAYSRPTRIIRGKELVFDWEVSEALFETDAERGLWCAFQAIKSKIRPGVDVEEFVETSMVLIQPLEDFFTNVFVMVEDENIRKNRLALLKSIAELPRGIVDLSLLPGF